MPNYKVFQDDASALKTQLFGNNGGTIRAITVNASGDIVSEINGGSVNATVTGTIAATGTVAVDGDVSVTGTVLATGTVAVDGDVSVTGTVLATGTVAVDGDVSVTGTVLATGTVAVDGDVSVTGTVAATGTVAIDGNVTVTGTVEAYMERSFTEATVTLESDTGTVNYALQQNTSGEEEYTWSFLNGGTEDMVVRLQVSPTADADDWIEDGSSVTVVGGTNTALVNGIYAKYTRVAYQAASSGTAATLVVYYNART